MLYGMSVPKMFQTFLKKMYWSKCTILVGQYLLILASFQILLIQLKVARIASHSVQTVQHFGFSAFLETFSTNSEKIQSGSQPLKYNLWEPITTFKFCKHISPRWGRPMPIRVARVWNSTFFECTPKFIKFFDRFEEIIVLRWSIFSWDDHILPDLMETYEIA